MVNEIDKRAKRCAKKKARQLALSGSTNVYDIVKSTRNKLIKNPKCLLVNSKITEAIRPVQSEEVSQKIAEFSDINEYCLKQTDDLIERIIFLEAEFMKAKKENKSLQSLSKKLATERDLIKQLVCLDEDIIIQSEQELAEIHLEELSSVANRSSLLKRIRR